MIPLVCFALLAQTIQRGAAEGVNSYFPIIFFTNIIVSSTIETDELKKTCTKAGSIPHCCTGELFNGGFLCIKI